MLLLVVALILFIGWHLVPNMAPQVPANVSARLGKGAWHAGFGIVSLLLLVFLAYAFGEARQETDLLYTPITGLAHLTLLLMIIAMICLVAALLPAGHIAAKLKFPLLVAIKIWALAHLLANGETSSVVLFAAFLGWAVFLRIRAKKRMRAGLLAPRAFVSARYDIAAVVIGLGVYALVAFKLHQLLIGVPVM